MSKVEITQRRLAATARGVGIMCDFYIEKAKNAELWDTDGNRYIDFAGGIGVLNTGHLHPKVQAAVAEQLTKFSHTCYQVVPYESYTEAAERINAKAPVTGTAKTFFLTTGAEAVENAIKVARSFTGRPGVISFQSGYHGRTNMTLGMTGKVAPYKLGFGPFPADIVHAQYPNELYGVSSEEALASLQRQFKTTIDPKEVAAIIIEPIQGEGGFNVTPKAFLQGLRDICDEHGIVLIFDEVQTGFARTGTLFATEQTGVKPDLITMAKSLAGGFPISGLVGKAEIIDAPAAGGLGGTYAGSPLALAAVLAVLDVIEEEKLCERSQQLGDKLRARLEGLKDKIPQIRMVRGLGGMIAVEFMKPGTDEPDPEFTKRAQTHALENGLILLTCGMYDNVMRFLFPVTIEDEIFEESLGILEAALTHAAATAEA